MPLGASRRRGCGLPYRGMRPPPRLHQIRPLRCLSSRFRNIYWTSTSLMSIPRCPSFTNRVFWRISAMGEWSFSVVLPFISSLAVQLHRTLKMTQKSRSSVEMLIRMRINFFNTAKSLLVHRRARVALAQLHRQGPRHAPNALLSPNYSFLSCSPSPHDIRPGATPTPPLPPTARCGRQEMYTSIKRRSC